jgi:class 3 adenylate cyclase
VTDAVYKAARDTEGVVWRERGRPALKGVKKPPATWRLSVARAQKAS